MDKGLLSAEVKSAVEDYFRNAGLELVELVCRFEGGGIFLKILADLPGGGITIGECTRINKELAAILEEKEPVAGSYTLEVSSPGLDRPLFCEGDFKRNLNKKAKFFLRGEVSGKVEWDGFIRNIEAGSLNLDTGVQILSIPLSIINKAKLLLE